MQLAYTDKTSPHVVSNFPRSRDTKIGCTVMHEHHTEVFGSVLEPDIGVDMKPMATFIIISLFF